MGLFDLFQMKLEIKSTGRSEMTKAVDPGDKYHMFNKLTRKYHCPRCTKTYGSKSGLCQHYRSHLRQFSYWCDVCFKGFTVKFNHVAHMAKHEGRTFPCDLCDKRFQSKRGLQMHCAEHEGQKRCEAKRKIYRGAFWNLIIRTTPSLNKSKKKINHELQIRMLKTCILGGQGKHAVVSW